MANVTIAANNSAIYYSPENWNVTSSGAITPYSGAYLNFAFPGSTLIINCSNLGTNPPYLKIDIDNEEGITFVQAAATITVSIPSRTSSYANHTCEITVISGDITSTRWTSPVITITGVQIASGSLTALNNQNKKNVLVFGDSIAEGFQTIAAVSSGANSVTNTDSSLGWAYNLRKTMSCNLGLCAFTGSGAYITAPSSNGSIPPLTSTWNYIYSGVSRTFASNPNMIIICIGANDAAGNTSQANMTTAFTTVLQNFTNQLPQAMIMICLEPQGISKLFVSNAQYTLLSNAINAAIAAVPNPNIILVNAASWVNSSMPSADGVHPLGYSNTAFINQTTASNFKPYLYPALKPIVFS